MVNIVSKFSGSNLAVGDSENNTVADKKSGPPYRLAVGLEYDGTAFNGWQSQPHAPSVQAELARAVSKVADQEVAVLGAGRTDTGVHATMQVAHFDTRAYRSADSWRRGINTHLSRNVRVHWVTPVTYDFHARFSALSRAYRYLILNRQSESALDRERVWEVNQPLNLDAMQEAAACLLGQHDFSSFRASSCQSHSPVRTMTQVELSKEGACIRLDIRGDAFLHHMVRNIVGSLVKVGKGESDPVWFRDVMLAKDRKLAGITAPPHGLYLVDVVYPEEFQLPAGNWPVVAGTQSRTL